jgi:eukaryotic-like serine/threonine-protein kinase
VIAIMAQTEGLIGEKLGSFRIEAVLGSGAMGIVYRGTNEKTGKPAAVKVVSSEYAQGGKIRDRFDREAEILQQFRHPNIVRFLAVGRFRGTSYIAMEFIQGDTLDKVLLERGPLPWREVVEMAIQIADALHYAHEHGVVHRDLKPSNLMVTADGKIKLTDFGIAKDLDATALTATGRTLGTAAYMSPEQIRGTPPVSHKTDLYSFGVVLHQMLAGRTPFEGTTPVVLMHAHLNEPPPRPSAKVAEIPKKLDDLIVNLMAKSPTDRPWDGAAVSLKLTELRDKAEKGAAVKMVWPSSGPEASNPPRSGARADVSVSEPPRKKTRKGTAGASRSTQNRRDRTETDTSSSWLNHGTVEVGLLALALVVIGGFIAYWVWPPSAEYLYKHAETLMASSRRADRTMARDDFIEELDRRFPNHPYREQTQRWRDQILLEDAEGRANALDKGRNTGLTKPDGNAEHMFLIAHDLAAKAHERGDDLTAIRQWQDFSQQVKDDPDERKWYVLALRRIEQLENEIKDRRLYIEKQIELAHNADRAGRTDEALTIKNELIKQFRHYTDLADIFPPALVAPGSEPKAPADSPASEKSDAAKSSAPRPPAELPAAAKPDEALPPTPRDSEPKSSDQPSLAGSGAIAYAKGFWQGHNLVAGLWEAGFPIRQNIPGSQTPATTDSRSRPL